MEVMVKVDQHQATTTRALVELVTAEVIKWMMPMTTKKVKERKSRRAVSQPILAQPRQVELLV